MNRLIYGQYEAGDYPLKQFFYRELPIKIKNVLFALASSELAIIRGGLAYMILLEDKDYCFKDLDMLASEKDQEKILSLLIDADVVYVNYNTFGDRVISAFWKCEKEYYKLDILIGTTMPHLCKKILEQNVVSVVLPSFLWENRIRKIAEKKVRHHEEQKTKHHYAVALAISEYLLIHREECLVTDIELVCELLPKVEAVLSSLISETELRTFMNIQSELTGEMI